MPNFTARRITSRIWNCFTALMIGIFWASSPAALAQEASLFATPSNPTYHRVTGVAADDVLNIRSRPTASSEIVGSLAPGAQPVEVLGVEGSWGRVTHGEGNGWVSMRFLAAINPPIIGQSRTPVSTICGGTEPFWDLKFTSSSQAAFSALGGQPRHFQIIAAAGVSARPHMDFVWMRSTAGAANAFLTREFCSDGMSDANFGVRIGLTIEENGTFRGLEGCCRVPVAGP